MHQRPRLRVENPLLFRFVVVRRFVIDFEKRAQRQHLAVAQQVNVIADRGAQCDLAIVGDLERAVVLSEPFVEPDGRVLESVVNEQVRVFVKDDVERVLSSGQFRGQRDVVDVAPGLKITRGVRMRLERSVGSVALEHYDRRGHRRAENHVRKEPGEDFAKLLEFQPNLSDLFLAVVPHHEEILRAHADPVVLRED